MRAREVVGRAGRGCLEKRSGQEMAGGIVAGS